MVSVVIPTFKHGAFILETLRSVQMQERCVGQVIVVDDGSPDDTEQVLAPLIGQGTITYVRQGNCGQAVARNKGLALATGEYVAFLDDDDLWPADKLQWQVEILAANSKANVVYGQRRDIGADEGTEWPKADAPRGMVRERFVGEGWIQSPGQTLIRRSAIEKIGGFDESIRGTDDWDLWLRLSETGEFAYRPKLALLYRRHALNAVRNFRGMYENGMKVVNKHFPDRSVSRSRAIRFVREFSSAEGLGVAREAAAGREWWRAVRSYASLARIRPDFLFKRFFIAEWAKAVLGAN